MSGDNDKAEKALFGRIMGVMGRVAFRVEAEARRNCPVSAHGGNHLRDSIRHVLTEDGFVIGTNVEYAKHVEFGTVAMVKAHGEHDPRNPVTDWKAKTKRGGGETQIMPFLRPAVLRSKDFIVQELARASINKK